MIANHKYFPETSKLKFDLEILQSKKSGNTSDINDLINSLNIAFENELNEYERSQSYFPGCHFETYYKFYEIRLKDYRILNPDHGEILFVKKELEVLKAVGFEEDFYNFYYLLQSSSLKKYFRRTTKETRDFLHFKIIEELNGGLNITNDYATILFLEGIDDEFRQLGFWHLEPTVNKYGADISTIDGFKTIIPLKDKKKNLSSKTLNKLSALETAYLAYYMVKVGEYKLHDNIGSSNDWIHFSKLGGGANTDNIRKKFKQIENDKDIRLKYSRKPKIQNTLSFIKNKFPNKKGMIEEVLNELKIVEFNN